MTPILFLSLSSLCLFVSSSQGSSTYTSRSLVNKEGRKTDYLFNTPDPFVSESSVAMAVICSDGVALLAVHDTKPEPLLYPSINKPIDSQSNTTNEDNLNANVPFFKDLPPSSRLALRIEPVDNYGSAIVATGWRTDCQSLASRVRDLSAKHYERYDAQGIHTTDDAKCIGLEPYGRYISDSAAYWLASCASSQKVRAMSCVGLYASAADSMQGGHLWLVDTTGAYPVRAHAIGFGAASINKRLMRINFKSMKYEEAISLLLQLLRDEVKDRDFVFVEMAKVQSSLLKMQRMRIPKITF